MPAGIPRYEVERAPVGPAGTSIPVSVSVSLTTAREGAAADLIIHVQDLRERRRAERDREQLIRAQSARAQAEAASERLRLMQSIAVAALGAEDLEGLLREVLDRLLEALDVDRAALVLTGDGARRRARGQRRRDGRRAGRRGTGGRRRRSCRDGAGPVAILDVTGERLDASSLGPAITLAAGGAARRRRADHRQPARRHADAARVRRRDGRPARPGGGARKPRDRTHAPVRARAADRRRSCSARCCRARCPACPAWRSRRAMSPATTARRSAATGTTRSRWPVGASAVGIGDVVGRGIEAAATMGQMRSALRAILMQADDCGRDGRAPEPVRARARRLRPDDGRAGGLRAGDRTPALHERRSSAAAAGRRRWRGGLPRRNARAADGRHRDATLRAAHGAACAGLDAAALHRRARRGADAGRSTPASSACARQAASPPRDRTSRCSAIACSRRWPAAPRTTT